MAINVDKVYRTVLSILNKESRGLITPDEFNKIGAQAQLSIIDHNIDGYNRSLNKRKNYSSNLGYGDNLQMYREKLEEVTESTTITFSSGEATLPTATEFYKILNLTSADGITAYEELPKHELRHILSSPLATPSASFPVYYFDDGGQTIKVKPNTTALDAAVVTVDYIQFPTSPRWGYLTSDVTGASLYDLNPYNADGLVVREGAFTSFTTNVTGATNGTSTVTATASGSGLDVDLSVTVEGGIVTSVETIESGDGYVADEVLTVTAAALGTTGTNLTITLTSNDLYSGSTAGSINFILHPSDEVKLIETILAYSGIIIRDPSITQMATQLMQSDQISETNS